MISLCNIMHLHIYIYTSYICMDIYWHMCSHTMLCVCVHVHSLHRPHPFITYCPQAVSWAVSVC